MSRSFFITDNRVVFIANGEGADLRYRAHSHAVAPFAQVPARTNPRAETVFVVEQGILEFMVGGAVGHAQAGDFVRIPPGVAFAYRNLGNRPAHILSRCVPPIQTACSVTISIAAA